LQLKEIRFTFTLKAESGENYLILSTIDPRLLSKSLRLCLSSVQNEPIGKPTGVEAQWSIEEAAAIVPGKNLCESVVFSQS